MHNGTSLGGTHFPGEFSKRYSSTVKTNGKMYRGKRSRSRWRRQERRRTRETLKGFWVSTDLRENGKSRFGKRRRQLHPEDVYPQPPTPRHLPMIRLLFFTVGGIGFEKNKHILRTKLA